MLHHVPRVRLLPAVLLLVTVTAASLAAQYPSDRPERGQGMGGRPGMGRRAAFDPVVVEGPPSPDQFVTIVPLDDAQKQRYATLYQNLMASTETERDQIRKAREARQAGGSEGGGDPDARRQSRDGMRETMQTLQDRQKAFDGALGDFLSKDQIKQYQTWRESRRKEAEDRFRQRRSGGAPPSGEAPPSSPPQ